MARIKEEFAAVADSSILFLPEFWSHGPMRGDTAREAEFS
jgi:hypothetical protein